MAENISNLLDSLKELDKQNGFTVYIPSLKAECKFKQLNIKQLKKILECVIDSPVYTTEFILTFNSIIKENSLDEIDTNKLTILDKHLIFVKTRIESISPKFTFTFTQDEIQNYNLDTATITVNLKEVYNNFIEKFTEIPAKTYTYNNIEITCSIPTLETENRLEEELNKSTKLQITSPDELRASIGSLFINELTKFIDSLKVNNTAINFNTLNFKSRIEVIESLPVNVITDILKYIEEYKTKVNELIVSKLDINGTEILKELPQDPTFFSI
jgi:hypothetical protein